MLAETIDVPQIIEETTDISFMQDISDEENSKEEELNIQAPKKSQIISDIPVCLTR